MSITIILALSLFVFLAGTPKMIASIIQQNRPIDIFNVVIWAASATIFITFKFLI